MKQSDLGIRNIRVENPNNNILILDSVVTWESQLILIPGKPVNLLSGIRAGGGEGCSRGSIGGGGKVSL